MFQPYVITKEGEMRRQALLQEAEAARQRRHLKSNRSDDTQGVDYSLTAVGRYLKAHFQVTDVAKGEA